MEKNEYGEHQRKNRLKFVSRFEEMFANNRHFFFDSCDLEQILDYYLEKDELSKALKTADFAIEQYPYSLDFKMSKADLLITSGNYDEALDLLEEIENLGNISSLLYCYRGDAFLFSGQHKGAIYSYRKALRLATSLEDKEELYMNLAYAYQCDHKYGQAMNQLHKCIEINPLNDDAVNELGLCIEILEEFEQGVNFFESIIDKNPYSYNAWYYLGICYRELKMFEKALSAFDYSIVIKEDFEWGYTGIAEIYRDLGENKKAIEYYRCVLKIRGAQADIYKELGECYLEEGAIVTARDTFETAVKLSGADDSVDNLWFLIGKTYEHENKLLQARQCYIKAIEKYRSVEYVNALGRIEFSLHNIQSAIAAFENATVTDPFDENGWFGLATCYFSECDFFAAIEVLEEGTISVNSAKILYFLGGLYLFIGQYNNGVPYLEEAMHLDFEQHSIIFDFFPELTEDIRLIEIIEQFH